MWTDGQTDTTNLIATFQNFANALKTIASPTARTSQTRNNTCRGRPRASERNARGIHTLDTQVNLNEVET